MKEKIGQIIKGIEKRIATALGTEAHFVEFSGNYPTREAVQLEMTITMRVAYESDAQGLSPNDAEIRKYLNAAGMQGKTSRIIGGNEDSGEMNVIYTVHLSTPERSGIKGLAAAKYDDVVTFSDRAVAKLATATKEMIRAIDKTYAPAKAWGYAGAAVIKEGTAIDSAEELPGNVITRDQFDTARAEALRNAQRVEEGAGKYKSHRIETQEESVLPPADQDKRVITEKIDPALLEKVYEQREPGFAAARQGDVAEPAREGKQ